METTAKITKSLRKEDVSRAWLVVDAEGQTLGRLSTQVATLLRGKHKPDFTPHVDNGDYVIAILNKVDLYEDVKSVLPIIQQFNEMEIFEEIIPISALKETHTESLIATLVKYMPENEFYFDPEDLSTLNERFFVSEIIREQLFLSYSEEIPYSTEVVITQFREKAMGKWFISADILVERKSQKIILIGRNGEKIKKVGERARLAVEDHLQTPVFLDLFVKVRDNWRINKNILKNLGY